MRSSMQEARAKVDISRTPSSRVNTPIARIERVTTGASGSGLGAEQRNVIPVLIEEVVREPLGDDLELGRRDPARLAVEPPRLFGGGQGGPAHLVGELAQLLKSLEATGDAAEALPALILATPKLTAEMLNGGGSGSTDRTRFSAVTHAMHRLRQLRPQCCHLIGRSIAQHHPRAAREEGAFWLVRCSGLRRRRWCCAARRPHADVWLLIWVRLDDIGLRPAGVELRKCKSHQSAARNVFGQPLRAGNR